MNADGAQTPDDVRKGLLSNIEVLEALSRSERFGVHVVFAGLYARVNRRLLAYFDTLPDGRFCYLAMARFNELYDFHVVRPVTGRRSEWAPHWSAYAALAARLTMDSSPNDGFELMLRSARAHVRYDLGESVVLAIGDFRRLHGSDPDLAAARKALLGRGTSQAFYEAALEYNAFHRGREKGWRMAQLIGHAIVCRALRSLWLAVLQSWRRAAWNDAMAALGKGEAETDGRTGRALLAAESRG